MYADGTHTQSHTYTHMHTRMRTNTRTHTHNQTHTHRPNGKHMCMVFELMGSNLLTLIQQHNYKGIPVPAVRHITYRLCQVSQMGQWVSE